MSKKKKKQLTNKRKRFLIANVFLALFLFIGIGYSALGYFININGDVSVSKYREPTLYNFMVKVNEGKKTGIDSSTVKKYTGNHQDSMNSSLSTETIYYWNNQSSVINNINNVIFAGHCWKILRTTDTGGTKLLYNGEAENGACPDNRENRIIRQVGFNSEKGLLFDVGYMYNSTYSEKEKKLSESESIATNRNISTSYYYSDTYDYNVTSANKYTLTDPHTIDSTDGYESLVGKYTLCNSDGNASSSILYYITSVTSTRMFTIDITNGYDLNHYNYSYTIGDSYTDNNNGTYTINNATTIDRANYNLSLFSGKYVCKNATNNTCNEILHVSPGGGATTSSFWHLKSSSMFKFSSGFTYDSANSKYILDDNDSYNIWDFIDTNNRNYLSNHHYTCWNTSGECNKLSYVYYYRPYSSSNSEEVFYLELENGKNIDDAIYDMLFSENVNNKDSTIKTMVENWYEQNLYNYAPLIEDTIYCNDRRIDSLGGFDSNGGSVYYPTSTPTILSFKTLSSNSDLSCNNETDKFSVSNPKAKLTYPIGLLTVSEYGLINMPSFFGTGKNYYLMSPGSIRCDYNGCFTLHHEINSYNNLGQVDHNNSSGVRPVISLIKTATYNSGDGSKENPFIIDTTNLPI